MLLHMVAQKRTRKDTPTIGFRFTSEDRKLISALKQELGVKSVSDLVRQGLRALAKKEGIAS
jgi:Arc/MetJ-type ribon-helix-helix transcriptional regulator